jgi:hypothetical protein
VLIETPSFTPPSRTDITVEWNLENYKGRFNLSGKEGEGREIAFSASLIV